MLEVLIILIILNILSVLLFFFKIREMDKRIDNTLFEAKNIESRIDNVSSHVNKSIQALRVQNKTLKNKIVDKSKN